MIRRAFVALGSNLGDREANIRRALDRIGRFAAVERVSALEESAAVDRNGSPDPSSPAYIDAVALITCTLPPRSLYAELLMIERSLGRDMTEKGKYLPRVIDLDILMAESSEGPVTIQDPDLVIPHPRLATRPFLLRLLDQVGGMKPSEDS